MRFKVTGRDQIFTHHPIVMWPSNTQPYFVCHLSLVLDATEATGATWRLNRRHLATGLVDMWSLKSVQEYKRCHRTKDSKVDYIQVRGRGLT